MGSRWTRRAVSSRSAVATTAGAASLPRAINCSIDKPARMGQQQARFETDIVEAAADSAAAASRSRLS